MSVYLGSIILGGGVNGTVLTFGLGLGLGPLLELLGERLVVEENVGVVELVVPGALEITHRADHVVQLFVTDEGDKGGISTGRLVAVRLIVVILRTPEISCWFTRGFEGSVEDAGEEDRSGN
jgi:hypothetical protein